MSESLVPPAIMRDDRYKAQSVSPQLLGAPFFQHRSACHHHPQLQLLKSTGTSTRPTLLSQLALMGAQHMLQQAAETVRQVVMRLLVPATKHRFNSKPAHNWGPYDCLQQAVRTRVCLWQVSGKSLSHLWQTLGSRATPTTHECSHNTCIYWQTPHSAGTIATAHKHTHTHPTPRIPTAYKHTQTQPAPEQAQLTRSH